MLRRAGLVIGALAVVWSCGGSVVSSVPDAGGSGEGDASGSSTGSSSGIVSSSSGASSSGVGSSTGSSGGNSASGSSGGSGSGGGSGSSSSGGSTSSGGGSGSGSSSGVTSSSSGGGSGSSSGGFNCGNSPCISDQECQASCPPVQGGGTNCCDPGSGVCYATTSATCPMPAGDACPSGGPICSPNEAGVTPPNPNTGSTACDDCIECSCADSWCACMGDSPADSMGNPGGCLGYTNCVVACVNGPDGGGVQPCTQQCGAMYSPQQVQEGDALISCLAGSCNSPAACGQ